MAYTSRTKKSPAIGRAITCFCLSTGGLGRGGTSLATPGALLEEQGLTAANRNGAGQIVASGAADAITKIVAEPLEGTKIRALNRKSVV